MVVIKVWWELLVASYIDITILTLGHQIVYFDNDPHLECLQCQQRIHNGNCQPRNRQYLFGILCSKLLFVYVRCVYVLCM